METNANNHSFKNEIITNYSFPYNIFLFYYLLSTTNSKKVKKVMKKKKMTDNFNKNIYVLKLEKDELVIANLEKFAQENSIGFAKIEMIGTLKNTTLGYVEGITGKYQ